MSGFFGKLKEAFTHKEAPKFKIYEPSQLKMIAMRTRVVLQTRMAESLKHITTNDHQFKYIGQDPPKIYNILQLIGQKVMEVQTMKILIEMMRKVQNLSPQIVKTNGDIALMRKELIWFQCILWFRKTRQIDNLEQFNKFCWDFFKGVDITTQLDLKCEVFQIYPVLKFLKKGEVLPLREILFYIQPYVSCNIQQNTLDSVFRINTEEIKKKIEDNPINKHKFASTIPQYQGNYSQIQNNNYIPQNQTNYSNIKQHNNIYIPYSPPLGDQKPFNTNPYQSNTWRNQQKNKFYPNANSNYNYPNKFYNRNQRQQSQTMLDNSQNYKNFNQPHPQQNLISNSNPYSQSNNAFNRRQTYNIANHSNNSSSNSPNRNTFQSSQPTQNIVKPEPTKPIQQKPSFYNSLLRVNSNFQNDKQTQPKIEPKPFNTYLDNKRQTQNEQHQEFQSVIPFINQNKDTLTEDGFVKQMRQLELMQIKNNLLVQEEIKRKENERIQKQLRIKRQQQDKKKLQAERLRLEQLRIQLQDQSKKRQQQNKRRRQEQEKRREEQYKHRIQQQQQRKQKQQEERKEREEQQRQKQYQARRLLRQREERESSEIQLNVFADNQREEVDRGPSGRFSSTFGMKIDFGQNQGEQFNFQSPHQVKSSILRFSKIKEENQQSEQKQAQVSLVEQDEQQSLNIIKQFSQNSTGYSFKLFYFKAMQATK